MELDRLKFVLIFMVFVSIISLIFFVSAESIDTSKIGVVEDCFNSGTYSLNEYTKSGLEKAQGDLGINLNTVKTIDENNYNIAL